MSKSELGDRLHALQHPSGKEIEGDVREIELRAVLHELEVFQVELEMQNRELRESTQALADSHERYVNLFDFAPVGYVTLNEQGVIKEINLTASSMLGIERRRIIDHTMTSWIALSDRPSFRAHLKKCVRSSEKVVSILHLTTKDKRTVPVELLSSVLLDAVTGETLIRTALTDLTERRNAEEERDRFFDLSSDLLCVMGLDGFFKRINPPWEKVLGYSREELMDRPYIDFVHPEDKEFTARMFAKVIRGERLPSSFQNRYVGKSGSTVWLTWSGAVSGAVFYGVARDTTQETLDKKSLEDAVENLDQQRKLRENFVSALSHDLRTPLTSIRLGVQMLARMNADPEALPKHATRVIKSIDRMECMIRDLLDANRIHAGETLPMNLTRFNLVALLSSTLESLSLVHGNRFELITDESIEGEWSKNDLRRVIENLVSNAVKYGASDEPIAVRAARMEGNRVCIEVHNFGNPIPSGDEVTLFDQFRRSHSAEKSGKQGWGVGLTLVRGIVEAHGGEIHLLSNAIEGTTFRIILPG